MFFFRTLLLINLLFIAGITLAQDSVSENSQKREPVSQEMSVHDASIQKKMDEQPSEILQKNLESTDNESNQINDDQANSSASDLLSPQLKPPQLKGSSIAVKVIFTLLGISLLIIGLAWLAKRVGVPGVASNHDMRVLTSLSLGPREKAVLVDVLGKKILLGTANGSVNTLHVFDNEIIVSETSLADEDEGKGEDLKEDLARQNIDDGNIVDDKGVEGESINKKNFSNYIKKIISSSLVSR